MQEELINVYQLQFLLPRWVYILIEHNNNNNMMASVSMLNSVVTQWSKPAEQLDVC